MQHHDEQESRHPGLRLRSPAQYDLLVWFFTLGRPRTFRETMLRPVQLQAGERVLDIGCGTGSLALIAKEAVGPDGCVQAVDASSEMVAYARQKATKVGLAVDYQIAPAQELPFLDETFDVALSTLALHHLPRPSREQLFREMRRVLKPSGRALVVDFAEGNKRPRGFLAHLQPRHGAVPMNEMVEPMRRAGLHVERSGPLGTRKLHFVLARVSVESQRTDEVLAVEDHQATTRASLIHRVIITTALLALILLHMGIGARAIYALLPKVAESTWMFAGAALGALLLGKVAWVVHVRERN